MEHLALEVFDLEGTGSKFATLPPNTVIHIRRTSQIFGSGAVFSQEFTLNIPANAHLFGSAGDIHGSRLHEQMNKRKARIWAEGLPLYLGYLRLGDEVEVDEDGNVDVTFESGQKTFEDMIEGTNAREVSVGDVVIGVALNRKRIIETISPGYRFKLDGLEAYAVKDSRLKTVYESFFDKNVYGVNQYKYTPYAQRWPKLVKSHGKVWNSSGAPDDIDYTNIQNPYDASHPFCNINICYPLKVNDNGEEKSARGYTIRLAHDNKTTHGGDNQTRYNNAPNFYLLHFIDHLFKDLKIYISENQAMDVEDLRRVFMLNYGCHYEELENSGTYFDSTAHKTPDDKLGRYGQYYIPFIDKDGEKYITDSWTNAGWRADPETGFGNVSAGKVLLRDVNIVMNGETVLTAGSIEGKVYYSWFNTEQVGYNIQKDFRPTPYLYNEEKNLGAYSAYLAYATGDNYPNVDISEIIEAMKSMFGVRFLFSDDYKQVRIVLLRNIFRSQEVQNIQCDIIGTPTKTENGIRGFRMTYGKGTEDTNYYYKGFNDLFPRVAKTWKDTTDTHDYSQWKLDAEYDEIKQHVSAMNKICYVTPVNGNAYGVKVDEEEDVLFPSLFGIADFMDAEDGDCSRTEDEGKTVEEVTIGASPAIMNEVNNTYASLFSGDLKAPTPENTDGVKAEESNSFYNTATKIATFARITTESVDFNQGGINPENGQPQTGFTVSGKLDVYSCEGYRIRMEDNYGISNGGTPFDEANPGLQFGIMRSSGADAHILYDKDEIENEEPLNDYWDVVPGDGAIDHPDTCDNYGNEWDYDGSYTITPAEAPAKLAELFPNSDAPFYNSTLGYITEFNCIKCRDDSGVPKAASVLIATGYSSVGTVLYWGTIRHWMNYSVSQIREMSLSGRHMFIEENSSSERGSTLVQLCKLAYGGGTEPMTIDNGVGSRYGRFSLKLRAEKLNPYFDPKQAESSYNRRYLPITNENLRGRGLCDQFYKEYSYWVRNARIVNLPVRMELAQLLTIDDTVRATVGDVTGFINEMEYDISMETGLGNVTMQMMYI